MVIIKDVYGKENLEAMIRIMDKHDLCLVSVIHLRDGDVGFMVVGQSENVVDEDAIDAEFDRHLQSGGIPPLKM